MKRFSIVLLAGLFVLFAVVPAFGQVTYVNSGDLAALGKRLNIGANPVFVFGYPADSLAAHAAQGWHVHAFDFPIAIRCADRDGKIVEGHVDPFEPLVVSVLTDSPTETVFDIHVVQKCGNPVFNRWVSIAKSPPPPERDPPSPTVQSPTPEPQPTPTEPVVVTREGGRDFVWDAWLGTAMSKSLESRAVDSFEGLYIDVPLTEGWTFKLAGATSQSNFEKYRAGVTHIRAYSGNMSRLQTGLCRRLWGEVRLQAMVGIQYDHKQQAWQPGPLLEGYATFPIGPIWNEEDVTYQTGTEALWFRTRHRIPVITYGSTTWSVGGEFMRNSFRDNPTGRFYHYYTERGHGFLHLESTWLNNRKFIALAGVGRGSKSEKWGLIFEAGTNLW
jgi:hypothetical protein